MSGGVGLGRLWLNGSGRLVDGLFYRGRDRLLYRGSDRLLRGCGSGLVDNMGSGGKRSRDVSAGGWLITVGDICHALLRKIIFGLSLEQRVAAI